MALRTLDKNIRANNHIKGYYLVRITNIVYALYVKPLEMILNESRKQGDPWYEQTRVCRIETRTMATIIGDGYNLSLIEYGDGVKIYYNIEKYLKEINDRYSVRGLPNELIQDTKNLDGLALFLFNKHKVKIVDSMNYVKEDDGYVDFMNINVSKDNDKTKYDEYTRLNDELYFNGKRLDEMGI